MTARAGIGAWVLAAGLWLGLSLAAHAGPMPPAGAAASRAAPVHPFLYLPSLRRDSDAAHHVLIAAFVPDGLAGDEGDEAFALQNTGSGTLNLGGWTITDGEAAATLPALAVPPGGLVWCSRSAAAFRRFWGRSPACEYEEDTDAAVPNASGGAPRLANDGDELQLLTPGGAVVDAVAFGAADGAVPGWQGPALAYYQGNPRFARAGQVFYRLFDPATLLPFADTDTAADWAQGSSDAARGRRAAYPGWDLATLSTPFHIRWPLSPPPAQVVVAPDNSFAAVRDLFAGAQTSIHIETYDLDHPDLARLLAQRAAAGVDVLVLLEGAPVGGLTDATRWAARQIAGAGGKVLFMVNDIGDADDRYAYLHAKMAVVDGHTLLVASENFGPESMPLDAVDGATLGRRGYALQVTDIGLAARAEAILAADADRRFPDIFPWQASHPVYGPPPPGYAPPEPGDLSGYTVRHPAPLQAADLTEAYLFTAPEASLTPGPLLDLIARAGPGDSISTAQLSEQPYWGAGASSAVRDPNPRLEALIAAARRGARVRLLLDSFFDRPDDARSNLATAVYVNTLARSEGLDLAARLANPTGAGLHGKLHLLALGDERWVVTGSLNGGEVSAKLNREVGLAVQSRSAYDYLLGVFQADWNAPAPTAP